MCTPVAALSAQAAGAAAQTVGAFYAAQSQRSSMRAQADIADLGARSALAAGEREQQRSMLATAQLKSRQRAAMAANGVDLAGGGTPARVQAGTDLVGEVDRATIEQNAIMSAWGYRTEASTMRAQAGAISPTLSAAGTLLTSATPVAAGWYRLKRAGAFEPAPSAPPFTGVW